MTIFIFNLNDRALGVIESNNKKNILKVFYAFGLLKKLC